MSDLENWIPFWNILTDTEKEKLNIFARNVSFQKGSFITSGNDDCLGALFLKNGQLRTYITSDDGREITLFRLHKGDVSVMSAACVFDTLAFDVAIKSMENTDAVLIPSNVLDRLKENNIAVDLYFSKLMNEQFSDIMWAMQQILFFGIDKRLAIFLWDETINTGTDSLHITHEDIAVLIGSAREVVTRILKSFAEDGIVELGRGRITIKDKSKLKELCDL